jgi:hypothetical protein
VGQLSPSTSVSAAPRLVVIHAQLAAEGERLQRPALGQIGFFGLIHGLAFAATLDRLGPGRWDRVAGILSFNLGIEAMQMLVVAGQSATREPAG